MDNKHALVYLYALLWRSVSQSDLADAMDEFGIHTNEFGVSMFDFIEMADALKEKFGTLQQACVMVELHLLSRPSFSMDAGDVASAWQTLEEYWNDEDRNQFLHVFDGVLS